MNTLQKYLQRRGQSMSQAAKSALVNSLLQHSKAYSRYSERHLTRSTIEFMESSREDTKSRLPYLEHGDTVTHRQRRKSNTSYTTQRDFVTSRAKAYTTRLKAWAARNSRSLRERENHSQRTRYSLHTTCYRTVQRLDGSYTSVPMISVQFQSPSMHVTGRQRIYIGSLLFTTGLIVASYLITRP